MIKNYIFFLCEAYILHKVNRYDIHGKRIFETNDKFYFVSLCLSYGIALEIQPIFYFKLKFRKWFKYGLKAQKLLAQGSALGIMAISKAPCKVGCSKFESKIRYKKWCYFGAAKLLIFNTLIYEIVL